ncbi:hypothetical protein AAF712_015795 [Marasmius tenuissimus]|uniref:Uncharacterized protein n=1 Tax=Marasmius tenuissimus TaxID=585030 RepID=A0ABR2Z8J1_9AGAR
MSSLRKRVGLRGNERFWPERWFQPRHICKEAKYVVKMLQRNGAFVWKEPMEGIKFRRQSGRSAGEWNARAKCQLLKRIARYERLRGQSSWSHTMETSVTTPSQSTHASRTVYAIALSVLQYTSICFITSMNANSASVSTIPNANIITATLSNSTRLESRTHLSNRTRLNIAIISFKNRMSG